MCRFPTLSLACGALVLSLAACTTPRPAESDGVLSLPDAERYAEQRFGIEGRVVLADDLNLSFPLTGQVSDVFVTIGDSVQAGDVLAELDATILDAELAMAQAELKVARANLLQARAGAHALQIVEAEHAVAAAGSASGLYPIWAAAQMHNEAAAQARLDYLLAQPLPEVVAAAEAALERARAGVALAEARRAQATLVSPVDGTVVAVYAKPHEQIGAGQALVHIADVTQLEVEAVGLSETDAARMPVGTPVRARFGAVDGLEVRGAVTGMIPVVTADHRVNYTATIALDEIPADLRYAMTAVIELPLE